MNLLPLGYCQRLTNSAGFPWGAAAVRGRQETLVLQRSHLQSLQELQGLHQSKRWYPQNQTGYGRKLSTALRALTNKRRDRRMNRKLLTRCRLICILIVIITPRSLLTAGNALAITGFGFGGATVGTAGLAGFQEARQLLARSGSAAGEQIVNSRNPIFADNDLLCRQDIVVVMLCWLDMRRLPGLRL